MAKSDAMGPVHSPDGNLPNKRVLPQKLVLLRHDSKRQTEKQTRTRFKGAFFFVRVLRLYKKGVTSKCSRERIIVALLSPEPV